MKLMLIIAGAVIALALLLFGFSALVVGKKSDKKGADDEQRKAV